jgi:hypothetical protein
MTYLLLERTYWTSANKQPLPISEVLEAVATCESTGVDNMNVTYNGKKVGEASLRLRHLPEAKAAEQGKALAKYALDFSGLISHQTDNNIKQSLSWQLAGSLNDLQNWTSIALHLRVAESNTSISATWQQGDSQPTLEVRKHGQVVLDMQGLELQTQSLKQMMGLNLESLPQLQKFQSKQALEEALSIQAYTNYFTLAGEKREARSITISLLGLYKVEFLFSKAGEIVRVDLPGGWQLVNPLIQALAKSF